MNRTVVDPNKSVSPPIFSSNILISGCLPFQDIETRMEPVEFVIQVRRHSFGVGIWDEDKASSSVLFVFEFGVGGNTTVIIS